MARFTVTARDFDTDADHQAADDRWSAGEEPWAGPSDAEIAELAAMDAEAAARRRDPILDGIDADMRALVARETRQAFEVAA